MIEEYAENLDANDSRIQNAMNEKTEELEKLFENFINSSGDHFDEIEKRIDDRVEISNR